MAAQLVALPAIERLSPRVIRILGGNPGKFTLQGTNTYLVGTGRRRILIDTGEGRRAWLDDLKATLEKENAIVESALLSHWHYDHVNGIEDLRGLSPGVRIYKNEPGKDQLAIEDGQTFETEGATLTASHTPGHTTDHMTFWLAEEGSMFTADNVLGQGTAVFENLGVYLSSLDKMRNIFKSKGRAYPGHGPVLEDGLSKIVEYVEHRKQREEQVVRTLRTQKDEGGIAWTAMEIVKVVYADVREDLHPAACGGVVQILEKLKAEGRVEQGGESRWQLTRHSPSL
ncbi:unnamed protein product [Clonostachys rosea]|uniref:Metallo-beta-lactamase domain-containing protein n=1 Tax=Bionectria ochroleuca TaxID=29856 RepID=A0ABY6UT37_BIOOC|nr:unnamed protein product [Clonostachys rosea]